MTYGVYQILRVEQKGDATEILLLSEEESKKIEVSKEKLEQIVKLAGAKGIDTLMGVGIIERKSPGTVQYSAIPKGAGLVPTYKWTNGTYQEIEFS